MYKLTLEGKTYQVRIQTRIMVEAQFLEKGRPIATGQAVCNPVDGFDNDYGRRLALNRALFALMLRRATEEELASAEEECPCFAHRWARIVRWLSRNKRRVLALIILLTFAAIGGIMFYYMINWPLSLVPQP